MSSPSSSLRVALVEDQPLFREMLTGALRAQPAITVVMSGGSVVRARSNLNPVMIDVALLDIELPDGNRLELGQMPCRTSPKLRIALRSAQDVMAKLPSPPLHERTGWSCTSKSSSTSAAAFARALRIRADGRAIIDPHLVGSCSARSRSLLGLANGPSRNRWVSVVVEFLKHSARPERTGG